MTRDVSDDTRAGWARAVLTVDGIGRFAAAGVVLASDKILRRADPSLKSRLLLAGARLTTSALLLRGAASIKVIKSQLNIGRMRHGQQVQSRIG